MTTTLTDRPQRLPRRRTRHATAGRGHQLDLPRRDRQAPRRHRGPARRNPGREAWPASWLPGTPSAGPARSWPASGSSARSREDEKTLTFQFTKESREGGRFQYELETLVTLEKETGKVSCPLPGLATLAQEHLDECIAARNGGDITRMIQKLFERQADLFPIRERGGVYFTPAEHASFVDRVQAFLGKVNGRLSRFPVPAGTPHGDKSVKDAVAGGIATLIEEHRAAVATFGTDTRELYAGAGRGTHPADSPQDRELRLLPRRGARAPGARPGGGFQGVGAKVESLSASGS